MTPFSKVFERFSNKIEDKKLATLPVEIQYLMMKEWLFSAISMIETENISMVHDITTFDEEVDMFIDDLDFMEIEALSLYMVGMWYEPIVNSLEHTTMFFGSKDEKWNNQKDHLNVTAATQQKYFTRARKMFRDYYYKATMRLEEE